MGRQLGCRGHVIALRRLRVGPYGEADMVPIERLRDLAETGDRTVLFTEALRPVESALADLPAVALAAPDAARLRAGQPVLLRGRDAPVFEGHAYATERGDLVALCEMEAGQLHPRRVFNLRAG